MKNYYKQFITTTFTFVIFCPAIAAAKTDLLSVNFCTNLANFNSQMTTIIDQKTATWNTNIKAKIAKAKAEGRADQLSLTRDWQKDDAVWAERFAKLDQEALTPADQAAASLLKTKIEALIKARRQKVAAALTTKNQAKEKTWTNYLNTVNQTVTNFKTDVTTLLQEAQVTCLKGDSVVAKDQFSLKRQNLSQSLAGSLNQVRTEAKTSLQKINTDYEAAVNEAWTDWRVNLAAEEKNSNQ